jgi:hypothetical protein
MFQKFWSILVVVCCTKNYPLSGLYPSFSIPIKNMSFQEQIRFPKFYVLSQIWHDGHGQEMSNSKCNILPPLCHVLSSFIRNLISIKHTPHIEDCTCMCLYSLCFMNIPVCEYCVLTWSLPPLLGWILHQLLRIYSMTILLFIIWSNIQWTIKGNMKH